MKKLLLLTLFLFAINVSTAFAFNYPILNEWELNLSVLNGETLNGNILTGLSDATDIDYIDLTGEATIQQTVLNDSTANLPFIDDGYIAFDSYRQEGASFNSNFDTEGRNLYVEYVGLTGVMNPDDSITFDIGSTQVGTINFYLTDDSDATNSTNPTLDLWLASFDLLSPSGGSDLDFYGGGGANATVDLTLDLNSVINPLLFTDSDGNSLDTEYFLHLTNMDSLLDDDYDPNPDNTNVIDGDGFSIIHAENAGQYKIGVVPEPATLMLFGIGLLGFASISRRKKTNSF